MIAVTGATGHLGRLVIQQLVQKVPKDQIIAVVRNLDKAKDLAALGVQVRLGNYDEPATLDAAFAGVDTLLLISASEVGQRERQHTAALAAAKKAKVGLLVYTSLLHADTSGISLAGEHVATEKLIRASGLRYVILRNGWYTENYTEHLGTALQHGALIGAAKDGRIAAATRADFAAAAVSVLTTSGHEGQVYELAGDAPFTMSELAAEITRQAGKKVAYNDMPADVYATTLKSVGLPAAFAEVLANADVGITRGVLDDKSGTLRRLIGRPTTSLADAVKTGLARV